MIKLYRGDCLKVLRRLPDASVQSCVTSPPYWGLRDYGVAGQLGLETTPEAYVARMVEVFAEVRRVMRNDGTLWLNMGDSYAGQGAVSQKQTDADIRHATVGNALVKCQRRIGTVNGLKSKDLVGMPWRLAFALQADGWYLRSDIIWHKPNPMPESVRDRPTKAHEYVFLMTKSERYFWDQDAVREEQSAGTFARFGENGRRTGSGMKQVHSPNGLIRDKATYDVAIRSVWSITPKPFKGAHFATFPPALVERCVKAGTSERGCCPRCGKPWERVTERQKAAYRPCNGEWAANHLQISKGKTRSQAGGMPRDLVSTLGFRPACTCPAADPVPCVVLDPFIGSGTTAAVARSLGRDCVGIDLNPKYLTMARARIRAHSHKVVASA